MIKTEDSALEKAVIDGGYHIALPFSIDKYTETGKIEITVYSFCQSIAEDFERLWSDDPFSDGAREYLHEKLTPVMESLEYDCAEAVSRIHYEYHAPLDIAADENPICDIISSLEGESFGDLPLDEFEFDPDDPCDRMAVVRENGKIVCYAGLNDICEDDGYYEITVECEEACRRRGYGKACISALAAHITENGGNVKYISVDSNIASRKTAEAAGFVLYKKCLPFVCYKITETDENEDLY